MKPGFETESSGARRLRLLGVGAVVAALAALATEQAYAGSMYQHSARSGELAGGRLTLHDVGRHVTWVTTGGRAGKARIARAHKRLFLRRTPATGTLHIAGQRGGEEPAFRLRDPRYNAKRRTVSYRARPLSKDTVAARAAAAAPRRFGAASLSVLPHSSLGSGDNGGNDCEVRVYNQPGRATYWFQTSSSKWDTDTWDPGPPDQLNIQGDPYYFRTDGGLWRGCSNTTVWQSNDSTITINTSWPWGTNSPTTTCTPTDQQYACTWRSDPLGDGWQITTR